MSGVYLPLTGGFRTCCVTKPFALLCMDAEAMCATLDAVLAEVFDQVWPCFLPLSPLRMTLGVVLAEEFDQVWPCFPLSLSHAVLPSSPVPSPAAGSRGVGRGRAQQGQRLRA